MRIKVLLVWVGMLACMAYIIKFVRPEIHLAISLLGVLLGFAAGNWHTFEMLEEYEKR